MSVLAVLVNPRARAMRRDPQLPARLASIARGVGEVHVPSQDALPDLVARLSDEGVSVLALCGGDGTGQAVMTALLRHQRPLPRIALLRGGTVNTISGNLGLRGTPEVLLADLCARLRAGAVLPTVRQDVLQVDERYGFLFAAALGARFLELYYERPEPTVMRAAGLAIAVATSALTSGTLARRLFRANSVTVTIDGAPVTIERARLVVASTVVDAGVGMRICPRARDAPGRFQLIVSGLSPQQMARQLPAVRAGRALEGEPHLDRVVADATLDLGEEEPYTLDGELFRSARVRIRTGRFVDVVRG